jgi:outer membrane lipoprotein SlyB
MRPAIRLAVLAPAALAASIGLGACARQISPNYVTGVQAGEVMRTEIGWVESARPVRVREKDQLQQNYLGAAIGGATGGYLGHELGGDGMEQVIVTGLGALAGATAGALAEQGLKEQTAMEYVFRNEIGEVKTIVQGPEPLIQPGQRAYLHISPNGRARLVPAG